MSMLKYNWGILGLGNIAHEFCDNMLKIGRPYAVASRDLSRAQQFQKKYSAEKSYGSYEELLSDPVVDIVYVATVNSEHYSNIKASLLAGKHVICEKAIIGSIDKLTELAGIAQESNLLLAEAMTIFHMPITNHIQKTIKDGMIGKLKYVSADLGSLKEDDPDSRFFNKDLGGGSMLDIGTYGLSWIYSFIEDIPTKTVCTSSTHAGGADESWSIAMKTADDVICNVNLTFRAKLPKRAIVAGEKAYYEVYNYVRAEVADLVFPDGRREHIKAGKTDDALLYEICNVERAIETNDYTICRFGTTLNVVNTMDHLLKSTAEE
jgi:Predicted dehydrogenases and related proteins